MSTPSGASLPNHDRLAALDALRFVAASSVLAFHYFFRGSSAPVFLDVGYPEVAGMAMYGYLGVNLFFMISGFVIAWSAEGRGAVTFALLRFARIYPAFAVCMSLTCLVAFTAADPRFPVSAAQWLANLFIFSPAAGQPFVDGVYWSIVLELIFYGWMTLGITTGLFKTRPLILVAGWMLISAINEFVLNSSALRVLLITEYSGWFAVGILMHRLRTVGSSFYAFVLLIAAMLLATATSFRGQEWMVDHYGVALEDTQLIAAVLALSAIFIATVRFGGALRSTPLLLAISGLTYPLYLLHQNIGYITLNCLSPLLGRWTASLVVVIAMVALAYLVFRWIELTARRWLAGKLRAHPVIPDGSSDNAAGNQAVSA
ncbi:acyltransferase family protein [Tianweitania populi]|uniref:Acyltransferase n=1 Tax=Tianweitania populi TaxID=1607949 RepID=A0A8J3DSZ3_9HYPH|nr:acyltransferase [Tianweitania populi]GHD09547.1 acyltransferase [Tianweitania populi]